VKYVHKYLWPLVWITGNRFSQNLLKVSLKLIQYLMGIGAGGDIRYSGEEAIFSTVSKLSKSPNIIFDVGANQGQFLSLALNHYKNGNAFEVHCFEPSKFTFNIISEKFKNHDNVTLNNFALGEEKGEMTLRYPFDGTGFASFTDRKMGHWGLEFDKSENVSVDTISAYCDDKRILAVSLLKVDVEGHEFEVLLGAKKLFSERRIDFCTFEFGGAHVDTRYSFKDFFYFFRENKMRVYRITPSGFLSEIEDYGEIEENYRDTNFLAAKEELMQ